ncbi:MAG: hypothetical protein M3357_04280 [Actinomycetota bacterium]|nr:hypothetical protein [Actinomycetota bacterium]
MRPAAPTPGSSALSTESRRDGEPFLFIRGRLGACAGAALVLALASGAGAAALRWAWLRRRRGRIHWAESHGSLQSGTLVARTLGEGGRPILLLHGLAGSGRYWGAVYDRTGNGRRG